MIIYPILIAITRIGAIWVTNQVGRKVLLSATHVLVLLVVIEIHNNNKKKNDDKKEY